MPTEPYPDSRAHLMDELARVDLLIKAATVRWRQLVAAGKPARLWGMLQVSDEEVDAYLRTPFAPPADRTEAPEREAAARIAERVAATPENVVLRLHRLVRQFELTDVERDLLLVALLPEVDGRYHRLFGYLQDDASRMHPSAELALSIVARDPLDRSALHPGASLLRHHLLAEGPAEPALGPLWSRPLQLDDRITAYLFGDDRPDGRLRRIVSLTVPGTTPDDLVLTPADTARLTGLADWVGERIESGAGPTLLILRGLEGSGRRSWAEAVCARIRAGLLIADLRACLAGPADFGTLVDVCYREAALAGVAVCWTGGEAVLDEEQPRTDWARLLDAAEADGVLTFVTTETAGEPMDRFADGGFLRLDVPMPDYRLRARQWERLLPRPERLDRPGLDRRATAQVLANGFRLTPGQIAAAVTAAERRAVLRSPDSPLITLEDLHAGARRQTAQHLVAFGRRVEAGTDLTFADLVLTEASRRQLEELRALIARRGHVLTELGFERRLPLGRGLIAMFTGTSGTGKTLTAELLARDTGVDLFKIDLSAVVSKYVGDTEKNLSKVFADAEYGNAILFFDEADALFGKRGKVEDARDRWANIEVNYLLQRVEEYAGVVILASNLQQNIDEAFLRRIQCIVDFPFPDAEARLRIWQGLFPAGLAVPEETELRLLAERFRVAGGSIRNIVLDGAFRALADAGDQEPRIGLRHLVASTAREYQKLGKPLTAGEFGPRFYPWVEEDLLLDGVREGV